MEEISNTNEDIHCSFCGKSAKDVSKLISGEKSVICNECIEICNLMLIKEGLRVLPNDFSIFNKKITPLYVLLVLIFCTVIYIALKLSGLFV